MRRAALAAPVLGLLPLALAGCGGGGGATAGGPAGAPVAVTAEDRACTVARTDLAAGPVSFAVTNKGSSVTEVYVYGRDGDEYDKIVAEVENIGPGTSRDLEATLSAGSYEIACKPGQQGDGIRSRVTVTGDAPPASAGGGSAGEPAHDREIELSTDGRTLTGLPADAPRGQKVEFKLENRAGAARTLEVRDPAGAVAGEVDVDPGSAGETVVGLGAAGDWRLVVEGDGVDDVVGTLPVR